MGFVRVCFDDPDCFADPAWLIEYLYEEGPDVNGYSFGLTTRSKTRRGRKLSTLYRFLDGKTGSVRRAPAGPIQPGSSCDQIFSGTLPEKKNEPVWSMCQMASVSLRATSTRATLAPRWRPSRLLVRW